MTTVEIVFRYSEPPSQTVALALGAVRDVYGIRRLAFDTLASTVLVEYDATRLNGATVANLLRSSGLLLAEEVALVAPPPAPVAAEAAKG